MVTLEFYANTQVISRNIISNFNNKLVQYPCMEIRKVVEGYGQYKFLRKIMGVSNISFEGKPQRDTTTNNTMPG